MDKCDGVTQRAQLHDTIVVYDCSFWCVKCCPKDTVFAGDLLANVAISPVDPSNMLAYITSNNRIRQSYRVDGA